jgi:hypothetical protein
MRIVKDLFPGFPVVQNFLMSPQNEREKGLKFYEFNVSYCERVPFSEVVESSTEFVLLAQLTSPHYY